MKQSFFFFTFFLLLANSLIASDNNKSDSLSHKTIRFKTNILLIGVSREINFGAEVQLNKGFAVESGAGFLFLTKLITSRSVDFEEFSGKGFTANIATRHRFFSRNRSEFYLRALIKYLYFSFNPFVYETEYMHSNIKPLKQTFTLGCNFGLKRTGNKRFTTEYYVGAGIRYRTIITNILWEDFEQENQAEEKVFYEPPVKETYHAIYPVILMGISLFFQLK